LEPKPRNWRGSNGKVEKRASYEWFETQDPGVDYHADFSSRKIIYPNMTKYLPFYLDTTEHFFINDKAFIILQANQNLGLFDSGLELNGLPLLLHGQLPKLGRGPPRVAQNLHGQNPHQEAYRATS
jgi:hypothetical protein